MTSALHITLAQINPSVGDLDYNARKILKIQRDAPASTDLIVLPEMAVCGYPPEDLILKPFFMEQVEQTIRQIAAESAAHKSALILPAPWRIDGQIHNVAHLTGEGRILATVAKHHLPNYGVFDEQRIFKPGPLAAPIAFKGHKLGLMVCEDMWFPDAAATLRDKGASMLIVVNASPYEITKQDNRLSLARKRVAETGLPLIYVNQCGGQDELVFDGASFILNENGRLVLHAEEFAEDIHHTVWEKNARHWLCLTDKIHESLEPEEIVYRALMTGLRDYVAKNGFPGVLIGLSGGIDSALTAAIAVDALGHDAVHCVMMPSRFTSKESLEDAAECAKRLGVTLETIPIEPATETFGHLLAPHLSNAAPSTTFENIQSRCRGLILMTLSNATGKMVLSTGNKSEMAVGYTTLYGDMCGGFNVLKDIYKTQVYALSHFRNGKKPGHALGPHGPVIPDRILTKAPTAELKPGQTDQDTLPPYDTLDDILACLIEHDLSIADIAARGHAHTTVARVSRMLDAAEYKRRQSPPGIKITTRAFGRDRRYPITNGFGRRQG